MNLTYLRWAVSVVDEHQINKRLPKIAHLKNISCLKFDVAVMVKNLQVLYHPPVI